MDHLTHWSSLNNTRISSDKPYLHLILLKRKMNSEDSSWILVWKLPRNRMSLRFMLAVHSWKSAIPRQFLSQLTTKSSLPSRKMSNAVLKTRLFTTILRINSQFLYFTALDSMILLITQQMWSIILYWKSKIKFNLKLSTMELHVFVSMTHCKSVLRE